MVLIKRCFEVTRFNIIANSTDVVNISWFYGYTYVIQGIFRQCNVDLVKARFIVFKQQYCCLINKTLYRFKSQALDLTILPRYWIW